MKIEPNYLSVGDLFRLRAVFHVPKYQRSYAWGASEVADFLDDILECCLYRKRNKARAHFMGGIVSIAEKTPGASQPNRYELVDGQQRVATFVILVACLVEVLEELQKDAETLEEAKLGDSIARRIRNLREIFVAFEEEINREPQLRERLKLSKVDQPIFRDLIARRQIKPTRDSHHRLKDSFDLICQGISRWIYETDDFEERLTRAEIVQQVVDDDCSLIHIATYRRPDAYRLFQVLNDRGVSLTEGDLLRARTLELLDQERLKTHQDSVETAWDAILVDEPSETENYLKWIYVSFKGERPTKGDLFDAYVKKFFNMPRDGTITADDARKVVERVHQLRDEFELARDIKKGAWPFQGSGGTALTSWQRGQLRVLVSDLRHTNPIPLVLAAYLLGPESFWRMIDLTQRFFFRYKVICKMHITALDNIYKSHAVQIREEQGDYAIQSYRNDLKALRDKRVGDEIFSSLLIENLRYSPSQGNKMLKYFLLMLEYYWRWKEEGMNGVPKCKNYKKTIDPASTTVEHILPRSGCDYSEEEVKMVDSIGNLTILTAEDNQKCSNKEFRSKRILYKRSSFKMNLSIASVEKWDFEAIKRRERELVDLARKVFNA